MCEGRAEKKGPKGRGEPEFCATAIFSKREAASSLSIARAELPVLIPRLSWDDWHEGSIMYVP